MRSPPPRPPTRPGSGTAARRHPARHQGPVRDQRRRHHRRQPHPQGLQAALRKHRQRESPQGRGGHARQAQHGRVRDGLVNETSAYGPVISPGGKGSNVGLTPGGSSGGSAAAVAATSRPARPAPTPAARSASPRLSPASAGSSRPTAAARAGGSSSFASSLDQAGPMAAGWRSNRRCRCRLRPVRSWPRRPPPIRPTSRRGSGRRCCLSPPGRDHRAIGAGLVRRAHCKLVHVELAEHARAGLAEIGGDGAVVGGLEALEDVAARRRIDAFGGEQVLDAERYAGERTALPTGLVGSLGRGECVVRSLNRRWSPSAGEVSSSAILTGR